MTTNKMMPYTQRETEYTPVSPLTGEAQCANCRFFKWQGDHLMSHCHIVEPWPAGIMPTGWCNEWEALRNEGGEPVVEAELISAVELIADEDVEMAYMKPKQPSRDIISRMLGRGTQLKSGVLEAGADGLRYGLILASNGFEDRDEEHVAQRSITEYTENNGSNPDNRLLFWHEPRLRMGDVVAAQMVGGHLVEIVKEADSPVAKILWDEWQATQSNKSVTWGASIGFRVLERKGNTFTKIKKRETSLLPLEAASNIYTYAGVLKMSVARKTAVDELFAKRGVPNFSEILETQGLAGVNAALLAAGHSAKGHAHEEAPQPGVPDTAPDAEAVTDVMLTMVSGYDSLATELEAMRKAYEDREKALNEHRADVEAMRLELDAVKAMAQKVDKALADELGRTPSAASQAAATKLPDSAVTELKKATAKMGRIGDLEFVEEED